MKFSSKVEKCGLSPMRKFHPYAVAAKARGVNIYHLNIGQPDVQTPPAFFEAVKAFESTVLAYAPSPGIPELIDAIQNYYDKLDMHFDKSEIYVTAGGSEALQIALQCILDDGDEILIQDPQWLNYVAQVQYCGGVPVRVPTKAEDRFAMQPDVIESLITPRTKAIMVNSPNNPTGEVYSDEQLAAIAAIAEKHDLLVISDEVYNTLLYTGAKFRSIAELPGMKARTVVVNSFSKSYAMTGWRIGYAAGPADIIDRMVKCQENFNACANAPGQYAAAIALEHPELSEQLCTVFAGRRKLLLDGLAGIDGIVCSQPEGAFYAFPDISAFGLTSQEFCEQLLERQKVVCIPGSAFGACGEGHIRVAYTCEEGMLQAAVERLHQFCREVRGA